MNASLACTADETMLIFTRLSKAWRILAGRLLALLYLLCVLAPGSAFAFGNARFADHCLFDDGAFAAVFHTHGASSIAHESGHKHASAPTDAMHHHDEQSDFAAESSTPSPRG